ncbi:hypothetical protein FO504_25910 [Bacillus cereus]|nr:hypothetical protein [Bacillus cereus]QCX95339.1 hypothetical protein EJ379_17845 [Bacillus cereus ATCC 14579]
MHYLAFNYLFRFIHMPITFLTYLSRYLWAVRPSPQNSAQAKKLGGGPAARKSPIDEGFYSVGDEQSPSTE